MENIIRKTEIPEGYEIDREKSTLEKIILKPMNEIKVWDDFKEVCGWFINADSVITECPKLPKHRYHKNVFLTEKQAQSSLAFAQITQLLPFYGGYTKLKINQFNYYIYYLVEKNEFRVNTLGKKQICLFYFGQYEKAQEFIAYNSDLLKQYFMVD